MHSVKLDTADQLNAISNRWRPTRSAAVFTPPAIGRKVGTPGAGRKVSGCVLDARNSLSLHGKDVFPGIYSRRSASCGLRKYFPAGLYGEVARRMAREEAFADVVDSIFRRAGSPAERGRRDEAAGDRLAVDPVEGSCEGTDWTANIEGRESAGDRLGPTNRSEPKPKPALAVQALCKQREGEGS